LTALSLATFNINIITAPLLHLKTIEAVLKSLLKYVFYNRYTQICDPVYMLSNEKAL
jgi:hypothetical protein